MAVKLNGQLTRYGEVSILEFDKNRPVLSFLMNDRWGVAFRDTDSGKQYSLTEHEELLGDKWYSYNEFIALIQEFIIDDAIKAAEADGEFIPKENISVDGDVHSFKTASGKFCEYKAGRGSGYDFSAWEVLSGNDLRLSVVAAEIDTDVWKYLGVAVKNA
ncbi:MAG: hypothetical protein Q4E34_04195 [Synergistaceae bacterium]|nr:hypothetical protein [Synergistaceae bacterium]